MIASITERYEIMCRVILCVETTSARDQTEQKRTK
jgi:hypothetical protein